MTLSMAMLMLDKHRNNVEVLPTIAAYKEELLFEKQHLLVKQLKKLIRSCPMCP